MTKFVVYEIGDELLIMTAKNEEKVVGEYFNPMTGRDSFIAERRVIDDDVIIVEARPLFKVV